MWRKNNIKVVYRRDKRRLGPASCITVDIQSSSLSNDWSIAVVHITVLACLIDKKI